MPAPKFSLLVDTRAAFAEVMAECPRCGAIATQVLELERARRTGPEACEGVNADAVAQRDEVCDQNLIRRLFHATSNLLL